MFEASGLPFVADAAARPWLEGLSVEVLNYWGRDNLVVAHPSAIGCG